MMMTSEDIVGSRSSIGVLRVLEGVSVALSITQIAQQAHLTRPAVISVLERLEHEGIVFVTRSGNARLYQMEPSHLYVEQVIKPLFDLERNYLDYMVGEIVEKFGTVAASIILFGSFARGDQTRSSDVDILMVAKDPLQQKQLEESFAEYSSRFYRRFGYALEAIIYNKAQAQQLHLRAPTLFTELTEDGRLISGTADWMKIEQT